MAFWNRNADPEILMQRADELTRAGNQREAVNLIVEAAQLGHPQAQAQLGIFLMHDSGFMKKDYNLAEQWLCASAGQGNPLGMHWLGELYLDYSAYLVSPKPQEEGLKYLLYLGQQGDRECCRELAERYRNGNGAPKDLDEAMRWYQAAGLRPDELESIARELSPDSAAAAETLHGMEEGQAQQMEFKGSAPAEQKQPETAPQVTPQTAFPAAQQAEAEGRLAEAAELYELAAEGGNLAAMEALAEARFGFGKWEEMKDPEAEKKWLRKVAQAGSVDAMLRLASRHLHDGEDAEAANWFLEADRRGAYTAEMVTLLLEGKVLRQSIPAGLGRLKVLAQKRDLFAFAMLGRLYREGKLVARDLNGSMMWFERGGFRHWAIDTRAQMAAQTGRPAEIWRPQAPTPATKAKAAEFLERALRTHAERRYMEEVVLLTLAAEYGSVPAMERLAGIEGDILWKEYSEADGFFWANAAAERGSSRAMVLLGDMYRDGRGVNADADLAMSWYHKAADAGEIVPILAAETEEAQPEVIEPVAEEAPVEPVAEETPAEPAVEEAPAEPTAEEAPAEEAPAEPQELSGEECRARGMQCLQQGNGPEAAKWLKEAAGKDDNASMLLLATLYMEGIGGVQKNEKLARRWIESYTEPYDAGTIVAYAVNLEKSGAFASGAQLAAWMLLEAAWKGSADAFFRILRVTMQETAVITSNEDDRLSRMFDDQLRTVDDLKRAADAYENGTDFPQDLEMAQFVRGMLKYTGTFEAEPEEKPAEPEEAPAEAPEEVPAEYEEEPAEYEEEPAEPEGLPAEYEEEPTEAPEEVPAEYEEEPAEYEEDPTETPKEEDWESCADESVRAFLAYRKAAEQGDPEAMKQYAACLERGTGCDVDLNQAAQWYYNAVQQGDVTAMLDLGNLYLGNPGDRRNYPEAIRWYTAAEQNGVYAEPLTELMLTGEGMEPRPEEAKQRLLSRAEAGDRKAMLRLAEICAEGRLVPEDLSMAAEWYDRLSEEEPEYEEKVLAIREELQLRRREMAEEMYRHGMECKDTDAAEALRRFLKAEELGVREAMVETAKAYWHGIGTEQDPGKAMSRFKLLASDDEHLAAPYLGIGYMYGLGTEQDSIEAMRWLTVAAEDGDSRSRWELGLACYEGKCVQQDMTAAVQHLRTSSETGDVYGKKAAALLGRLYYTGEAGEKSVEEAARLLTMGEDELDAQGTTILAGLCRDGIGTEKDDEKATALYLRAARMGVPSAMRVLGVRFSNGVGIEQSEEKALYWYRCAAEQGDRIAQYNLAVNLMRRKDPEAAQWMQRSAEQGFAPAIKYLNR